jgi:zinc protease
VTVNRHLMFFVCTCLADDFEPVFTLLGDVLARPSFPEEEVVTRKGEVVTMIRQDDDSPAVQAVERLMALLYGEGHPYGRRAKGTIGSVETLARANLEQVHRDRFAPAELSVVVVGDVEVPRVFELADRIFGGWTAPRPQTVSVDSVTPAAARRRLVVPMPNKAQADIAYGFVTVRRSDPSYYAFWLLNNVLGQYALGGRLGATIRERQGMAYHISSVLDATVVEGPLMIRAGVSPADVDRAIASIDQELTILRRDGVTLRELDESRGYLVGSMPRALETNAGIATFLQTAEFFGLGLDYDLRLPDLLEAVSLEEVNKVARGSLNPERATIVIAGPYEG